MKIKIVPCVIVMIALAISVSAADYNTKDGNVQISAPVIEYATPKITASGGVHLEAREPSKNTKLFANAKRMTVTLGKSADAKAGAAISSVKNAQMTGPVKITLTSTDEKGVTTKSTASADSADYDSVDGLVHLIGNVKITNENPELYELPAVATGEKATINLYPGKDGESAFRFKIESASGVSRIEVTPKQ